MLVTKLHRDIIFFQHIILCQPLEFLEQEYLIDKRKMKDILDGAVQCDELTLDAIKEMGTNISSNMPEESRRLVLKNQIQPKIRSWHDIDHIPFRKMSEITGFSYQAVRLIYTGETDTCRVSTIVKIIKMPKRLNGTSFQQSFDSTEFTKDLDRWVSCGIPYTTIMFYCDGLESGPIQNRHHYSNISKETRDAWLSGKEQLDKIADSVESKDNEKQEALRAEGVSRDIRVCPVCGKKFNRVSRNNQKYCSKLCYRKAQLINKKVLKKQKSKVYEMTCPICGTIFSTTYSYKKYCSPRCANKAKRLKAKQRSTK